MAIEQVPYTNFHDLNLDWVLKVTKEAEDIIASDRGEIADIKADLEQAVADAQTSAQEALTAAQSAANANVNATLSANSAQSAASRARESAQEAVNTISNFGTSVSAATADWLSANVDPETGYVIDNTLTIAGAAADAKTVGDRFGEDETILGQIDMRIQLTQIEINRVVNNIANPYDYTLEYVPGDYVMYDNRLQVCLSATSGTFDATKWQTVTVISQVGQGGGGDTYTKAQTNALLAQKVDTTTLEAGYYDKSTINNLLSDKVGTTALNNYYDTAQIDTMMSAKVNNAALSNYYNKTEADDLLDTKANVSALNGYYTKEQIDTIFSYAVNPYPVGSIYMSINSTDPSTLFGGTWTRLQDTFLLAAGTSYAAGSTGGEAEHLLTAAEAAQKAVTTSGMSANITHTHTLRSFENTVGSGTNYSRPAGWTSAAPSEGYQTSPANIEHTHSIAGSNAVNAHNNMPPYLAVYMWQRTA